MASEFLMLRNNWWRTMITPPDGKALLYADWSSQEIAVAALERPYPPEVCHDAGFCVPVRMRPPRFQSATPSAPRIARSALFCEYVIRSG